MRYQDFERIISQKRLRRYVAACGGNTRKAMTLYRYNVELAQSFIESGDFVYGLDHVTQVCNKIDKLKPI